MEGIVTFYADQIDWFHAYNDDAIVISNIIGYKLFERFNGMIAIGFPREYLKKVTNALKHYNIGYSIFDDGIIIKYPNSKYKERLDSDFVNKNYVFYNLTNYVTKNIIKGSFTIQYNDEEPITREVGVSINPKAKIVEFVAKNEIGNSYEYGDDIIKIISKNLDIETI